MAAFSFHASKTEFIKFDSMVRGYRERVVQYTISGFKPVIHEYIAHWPNPQRTNIAVQ